jgi:hypothetical protein
VTTDATPMFPKSFSGTSVGDTWETSTGSRREVVRLENGEAWVRESECPGVLYRYRETEIPGMKKAAEAGRAIRAKWAAQEAERLAEAAEARSFDGWAASLSLMERGRAEKVLLVQVLYRGRPMSRRDVVRLAVSEGAFPNYADLTLDWPDGRFLRMPKLAVDYARHLFAKTGGAL